MNKKNFAIASPILGFLAIISPLIGLTWLGWILALAGLVLGFLGMKSEKKTLAIVGIVLSFLGIISVVVLPIMISNVLGDVSDALGG